MIKLIIPCIKNKEGIINFGLLTVLSKIKLRISFDPKTLKVKNRRTHGNKQNNIENKRKRKNQPSKYVFLFWLCHYHYIIPPLFLYVK
jgi:hypothetical protein